MAHARAGTQPLHAAGGLLGRGARERVAARFARAVPRRHRTRRTTLAKCDRVVVPAWALIEFIIGRDVAFALAAPAALPTSTHLRPWLRGGERAHAHREILRDLAQETRRWIEAQLAEQRSATRKRQRQLLARPRHADVAEAPLLGHLVRVLFAFAPADLAERTRVREDALFHPGEPHRIELESLGRMQRHQRDAVSSFGGVGIADERELFEKAEQGRVGRPFVELRRGGGERGNRIGAVAWFVVCLGAAERTGSKPRLRGGRL